MNFIFLCAVISQYITPNAGILTLEVKLETLAKHHVEVMQQDNTITNVIKLLVSQGEVCKVIEHKWQPGRKPIHSIAGIDGHVITLPAITEPRPIRHCLVCGKTETREIGDWK